MAGAERYLTEAQQNPQEHRQFVELLQAEGVASYLEIGARLGGSLWKVANALPAGALVVAVDLPWGDQSTKPDLVACVAALEAKGYDARVIFGDSTDPEIVARVDELAPFDAVFIDGNHTFEYVTQDWKNYRPMASKLCALHDIGHRREVPPGRMSIDVPRFWEQLKLSYRHAEIMFDATQSNGIGIVWTRPANA